MIKHMKLPSFLTTTPKEAAKKIVMSQEKGKNIVYIKWFWKWIVFVLKIIPERIYKKMSL